MSALQTIFAVKTVEQDGTERYMAIRDTGSGLNAHQWRLLEHLAGEIAQLIKRAAQYGTPTYLDYNCIALENKAEDPRSDTSRRANIGVGGRVFPVHEKSFRFHLLSAEEIQALEELLLQ